MIKLHTACLPALALVAVCSAAGAVQTAGLAVFVGSSGSEGEVRIYEEHTGFQLDAPPELAGIELLPIDFVGRTELERFLPDRPIRRTDIPGAARLSLPNGRGNLYAFRRNLRTGPRIYGFLFTASDGTLKVIGQARGIGPGLLENPYVGRIAVGPSGSSFLAATREAAGGDLMEIDLSSGTFTNRTPHHGPIEFGDAGLWLNPTWGFGISSKGIYRFDRKPAASAHSVALPAPGAAWFSAQAVVSDNRRWAMTTAGKEKDELHAYVFGSTGDARRVSSEDDELSGAGFLPEARDGPFMAVANDGRTCAWCVEGDGREVYMTRLAPTHIDLPVHVTANQFLESTLDEVGILSFFGPDTLVVAAGERNNGLFEELDLFQMRINPGSGATVTNLSLTGDTSAPFDYGEIELGFAHRFPNAGGYVLFDEHSSRLYTLTDAQSGVQNRLDRVQEVEFIERAAAGQLLLSVRRSQQPLAPFELWRLSDSLGATASMLMGPSAAEFVRPASRGDGWVGVVLSDPLKGDGVARVNVITGEYRQYPLPASNSVSPIGFSGLGSQFFSRSPEFGSTVLTTWQFDGQSTQVLLVPIGTSHALP